MRPSPTLRYPLRVLYHNEPCFDHDVNIFDVLHVLRFSYARATAKISCAVGFHAWNVETGHVFVFFFVTKAREKVPRYFRAKLSDATQKEAVAP